MPHETKPNPTFHFRRAARRARCRLRAQNRRRLPGLHRGRIRLPGRAARRVTACARSRTGAHDLPATWPPCPQAPRIRSSSLGRRSPRSERREGHARTRPLHARTHARASATAQHPPANDPPSHAPTPPHGSPHPPPSFTRRYWSSKGERAGANPLADPLAIIGILAIFFPFIFLLIAIALGYVDVRWRTMRWPCQRGREGAARSRMQAARMAQAAAAARPWPHRARCSPHQPGTPPAAYPRWPPSPPSPRLLQRLQVIIGRAAPPTADRAKQRMKRGASAQMPCLNCSAHNLKEALD